jgi:8-oxo-dGTP pyrophosphatase MutT (NUDIX family)
MKNQLKTVVTRLRLYWLAAWLYETYRLVARPHTHGALVAIWWGERFLLVQSSYRRSLSLPGGGLEAGETALQAAVRELAEELDLVVVPEQLGEPWTITERSKRGRNTVTILALPVVDQPAIGIDNLEIVGVQWVTREEALALEITSHLREYLQ